MCSVLRRLSRSPVRVRHVQVINRDTADEVVEMVRFGRTFKADRVTFKLASLDGGTEASMIRDDQRARLLDVDLPRAAALAAELGVRTNLDLFTRQLAVGGLTTAPMSEIGCSMGYVFTRVTVDGDVLFCCNTETRVGSIDEAPFAELWWGPAWTAMRARIDARDWFDGCARCGKIEQNVKWAALRWPAAAR
jgi:hypothetical protein